MRKDESMEVKNLRVPPELMLRIREASSRERRPASQVMREAIELGLPLRDTLAQE